MDFSLSQAVNIISEKLMEWLKSFTAMLPNFVIAILVLVLFIIIAKLIRRLSNKLVGNFSDRPVIKSLFSNSIYVAVIILGLLIGLKILHLEQAVGSLLAGAGIIGLALGFAFQDISANLISGVMMAFRRPIEVGQLIESNGFIGKVDKINLRVTQIKSLDGKHVLIPNKDVYQNPIINYTKDSDRRVDLAVGVGYEDDLEKAKKLAIDAVQQIDGLKQGREVKLFYTEFGGSSINYVIQFWLSEAGQQFFLEARSQAIMNIKKAYAEGGIDIPFPIRTLDVPQELIDAIANKTDQQSAEDSKASKKSSQGEKGDTQ